MSPSIPKFDVEQDDKMVYIDINVPYVRVSDMEFYIDGSDFTFYCRPYLLKLQFPGLLIEDEQTKAVYDVNRDNGTIRVHVSKQTPGEHFPDLDMLTKLLQKQRHKFGISKTPSAERPTGPLIQLIDSSTMNQCHDNEKGAVASVETTEEEEEEDNNNRKAEEDAATDKSLLALEDSEELAGAATSAAVPELLLPGSAPRYGFNDGFQDFFKCWHSEVCEIISLPDPDRTAAHERKALRLEAEAQDFDADRYLGDLQYIADDPLYLEAVQFVPYWEDIQRNRDIWHRKANTLVRNRILVRSLTPIPEEEEIAQKIAQIELDDDTSTTTGVEESRDVTFSDLDTETLRKLPNKEYLIQRRSSEERRILCSMVDILIGFAYDNRMTQADSTIESSWTISILSPTLSWLDTSHTSMNDVLNTAVRRMLTYPYIRHYEFSKLVLEDCLGILRLGRRCILRSFLQVYRIFEVSETRYLLRNLYIEDYCVWLQHFTAHEEVFEDLADEFETALRRHTKASVGLDLDEIETWIVEGEEDDP